MDQEVKLKNLVWYLKRGWPVFPCGADKNPLTKHGFKDASLDINVIKDWHERWPEANWAVPTGPADQGGAGLVVIDIDNHPGKPSGFRTWEQLLAEHPEPIDTVTVRTGGGGSQLYFKYPTGHNVTNKTNIWPSIDVRGRGGYVLVPPSKTEQQYSFEFSPADTDIMDIPGWILEHVNGKRPAKKEPSKKIIIERTQIPGPDLAVAISALNALKPERVDDYQMWLEVGMSLYDLGEDGLTAWDTWSQRSPKYERGMCAKKWKTFTRELTDASRINFGSLVHWAEEDGLQPFIRPAPKSARPGDYLLALNAFGYQFSLNEMNDMVFVNGMRLNDVLMAGVEYNLRNHGYRSEKDTQVSIYKLASDNSFHPIKDYLSGLVWEGWLDGTVWNGVNHIGHLSEYFEDMDGIFPILIRKWLIGAVGRIMSPHAGQQHPMLVLDGAQGIGKSRFAWWLGSPLPAFYIQSPINTNDKDFLILLCSKFVWEVEELGATFRKSDLESLKSFLSKEIVTVRKPYAREEIVKPATASFIGTINNSCGFLADPTGSRRFRVCTLTKIDWSYETNVDVNQVWAQAVALFKQGETWELDPEQQKKMNEINSRYDVEDPLLFDLVDRFYIDPHDKEHFTATAQIIYTLRTDGKIIGGSDQLISNRIANILSKMGCENTRRRINGKQVRAWCGVWERDVFQKSE